jgi:neutral trehalase
MQELDLGWPTYLFNYYEKLKQHIYDTRKTGKDDVFLKLNDLNDAEVRTLAKIFKTKTQKSLLSELNNNSPSDQMKSFVKKYQKPLSEVK